MDTISAVLHFLNIRPDKNQKWVLMTLFITGLLYTYVSPSITKEIITNLPAEWLAFDMMFASVSALVVGTIWKGCIRRCLMRWFMWLCIAESIAGFVTGMWLCFVNYNVWVFAVATLLYSSLISEFVIKCTMAFKSKLWNEQGREIFDNNVSIICSLYCIIGCTASLLFMPTLKVAMCIWALVCATDNIGWIFLYNKKVKDLLA